MVTHAGWQLELTGYTQVDAIPWAQGSVDELDPATHEPLDQIRFLIRRARLRAEAHKDALSAAIELDGNTTGGAATARLLSAQVAWRLQRAGDERPLVVLSAGLFKTPFGAEVPAAERDKPFLEPPAFARALVPGSYDAGVMAQGSYGLARWSVAVVNGAPLGDLQWKGKDPASSYDLVGRLGAVVDGPRRLRVEAGVSGLTGRALHAGTPPTKDDIQWVDDNQNGIVDATELQIIPGSPGTPSSTFAHQALGVDLSVHWCLCVLGTGAAFFEAALATNLDRGLVYADPVAASRNLRQLGYAIGAVQHVGAYAQVGLRYDRYDADRDAVLREGLDAVTVRKRFSTLAVMATGQWPEKWPGARLVVEYDRQRNPFGRGDDGSAVARAADQLIARVQVGF